MKIERKYMRREDWRRIVKRQYACGAFRSGKFQGMSGLIRTDSVTEPFCRSLFGREFRLVDDGYYWLQIAPEGQHWWLTVMYDDRLRLIQYYFDVTAENLMGEDGEAAFDDLFLDVVHVPGEGSVLTDEDELDAALAEGVIDERQHAMAHRTAQAIMKALKEEEPRLAAFCMAQVEKLKAQFDEFPG